MPACPLLPQAMRFWCDLCGFGNHWQCCNSHNAKRSLYTLHAWHFVLLSYLLLYHYITICNSMVCCGICTMSKAGNNNCTRCKACVDYIVYINGYRTSETLTSLSLSGTNITLAIQHWNFWLVIAMQTLAQTSPIQAQEPGQSGILSSGWSGNQNLIL